MSPRQMREQAAAHRQAAKAKSREAADLDRQADQLEYEAGLVDAADCAELALDAVRSSRPGIEAALEGAIAAEQTAHEAADEADRYLATAQAEERRADENRADPSARADAAVRVAKAQKIAAEARAELARASAACESARQARIAWIGEESAAEAAYRTASAAAAEPGHAPRTSPLQLGLGRPDDMTPEERQLVAAAILALSASGGTAPEAAPPAMPGLVTTAGQLAAQDPSRMRFARSMNGSVAIPPRRGV